jgi:hypothetical protein
MVPEDDGRVDRYAYGCVVVLLLAAAVLAVVYRF